MWIYNRDKEGGAALIVYDPFWNTIKSNGISTYALIQQFRISSSTIQRIRDNLPLSTVTIDDLCRILDCRIEDIAQYRKENTKQDY